MHFACCYLQIIITHIPCTCEQQQGRESQPEPNRKVDQTQPTTKRQDQPPCKASNNTFLTSFLLISLISEAANRRRGSQPTPGHHRAARTITAPQPTNTISTQVTTQSPSHPTARRHASDLGQFHSLHAGDAAGTAGSAPPRLHHTVGPPQAPQPTNTITQSPVAARTHVNAVRGVESSAVLWEDSFQ